MQYFSTNHISPRTDLRTAVLNSLPADNGLYLPERLPTLSDDFIRDLNKLSIQEIAHEVIYQLTDGEISNPDLKSIIDEAFNFPVVINKVNNVHIAELWHGPTLAFKDFGARFMSRLFSYFLKNENNKLTILTATSGDTGGAVASGFFNAPNIEVVVLYPTDKVSDFQERQITTWGNNIKALSIDGTFDDCQRMVKQAFLDEDINKVKNLSSANSINIARLIPQTIYYFEAIKHFIDLGKPITISVPSGNFGNITAGVIAQKMGLPISHFIAATNKNDIVPQYLVTGKYAPRPSIATISNAMDVGDPSNFPRLIALHNNDWPSINGNISGYHLSDDKTLEVIAAVHQSTGYVMDPHTAIGYQAMDNYLQSNPNAIGIALSTAHPIKFESALSDIPNLEINSPASVDSFYQKDKAFTQLFSDFDGFKHWLLQS